MSGVLPEQLLICRHLGVFGFRSSVGWLSEIHGFYDFEEDMKDKAGQDRTRKCLLIA